MASDGEPVTLPGHLLGMGRTVTCSVTAFKLSLRGGTGGYNYLRPTIRGVPANLPDGLYTITFDGKNQEVQREGGVWISALAG